MRKKELFETIIKILGVIGMSYSIFFTLPFLFSIPLFKFSEYTLDSKPPTGIMALSFLFKLLFTLIPSYICLFKTKWILFFLKINDKDSKEQVISKDKFYHILIITFGFLILTNGLGNFLEKFYINNKTIKNEYIYSTNSNDLVGGKTVKKLIATTITEKQNRTWDFFSLFEVILGTIFLLNATKISNQMIAVNQRKLTRIASLNS